MRDGRLRQANAFFDVWGAGFRDIDVLVACIVPEDLWYVVPVSVFRTIKSMKLFPSTRRRRSKFEVYREGWQLLGSGSLAAR